MRRKVILFNYGRVATKNQIYRPVKKSGLVNGNEREEFMEFQLLTVI